MEKTIFFIFLLLKFFSRKTKNCCGGCFGSTRTNSLRVVGVTAEVAVGVAIRETIRETIRVTIGVTVGMTVRVAVVEVTVVIVI